MSGRVRVLGFRSCSLVLFGTRELLFHRANTHKCSMQPPQGGTSHTCNICTPPRTHRAVCNPLQVLPCQQQKAKCPGFLWKSLERVDKLYTMLGDHVDMRSSWTKQNRASWQTASDRRFPTFSCILTHAENCWSVGADA